MTHINLAKFILDPLKLHGNNVIMRTGEEGVSQPTALSHWLQLSCLSELCVFFVPCSRTRTRDIIAHFIISPFPPGFGLGIFSKEVLRCPQQCLFSLQAKKKKKKVENALIKGKYLEAKRSHGRKTKVINQQRSLGADMFHIKVCPYFVPTIRDYLM